MTLPVNRSIATCSTQYCCSLSTAKLRTSRRGLFGETVTPRDSHRQLGWSWHTWGMSVHEILEQIPTLSDEERELVLRKLVNLDEGFAPTPAMEEAIREGLRSLSEERSYSAEEVRSRIAAWTAR